MVVADNMIVGYKVGCGRYCMGMKGWLLFTIY